jgi:hypothetical protein
LRNRGEEERKRMQGERRERAHMLREWRVAWEEQQGTSRDTEARRGEEEERRCE